MNKSYNPSKLPPLRKRMSKKNYHIRMIEVNLKKILNLAVKVHATSINLDTLEVK